MKKLKVSVQKLALKKSTIAPLNNREQLQVNGGVQATIATVCTLINCPSHPIVNCVSNAATHCASVKVACPTTTVQHTFDC